MRIHLIFITFNRLHYTRLSLPRLLEDPTEEFELTIWDNASTDGTRDYLQNEVKDPRIGEIVFSDENVGQVVAINKVWGESTADLLGKVDNDCLVTPGWTRTLARAHGEMEHLGVIACWHYFPEDFDHERAKHKIQTFGSVQIFRHANTCGSGLLIKRRHFLELGPLPGPATTTYWFGMALAGYVNGFYHPIVHQEHMDDPKSEHSVLKDEASYQAAKAVTFGLNFLEMDTLADRYTQREEILRNLLDDPYDPRYYLGWRAKFRRLKWRIGRFLKRRRLRRPSPIHVR